MLRACLSLLGVLCLSAHLLAESPWRTLDAFEDIRAWKAAPSDGVALSLAQAPGTEGNCLRMDFDFKGGAGYAAMRRALPLELPGNYEISFWVRGACPENTLEFKLVDASGENVWWVQRPRFRFPGDWTRVVFKKRHVTFAWGPKGGGEPRDLAALEVAITAGKGGKGHVDIDGLSIRELPPVRPYDRTPLASASNSSAGCPPALALDENEGTAWRTSHNEAWFQLDFGIRREFGGLILHWDPEDFATEYEILGSEDGRSWTRLRSVRGGGGGIRPLALPEGEARFLRLRATRTSRGRGMALRGLSVQPLAFSASPNAFIEALARKAPKGDYPRAFLPEQAYWTVLGVDGGVGTGLLGEDGALEPGRGRFSVEPFLWSGGRLIRWSDAEITQSLERGYLPVPSVQWKAGSMELQVTAFAAGSPKAPVLRGRYRVRNGGAGPWRGCLFLALRPFQVNPPAQFLGTPGGVSEIRSLAFRERRVRVDGREALLSAQVPDGFGAMAFDGGNLLDRLHRGALPEAPSVEDPTGLASGALRFDLELAPGAFRDIEIDLPLRPGEPMGPLPAFQEDLASTLGAWEEKLNRVAFRIPDPAVQDTLRTGLAHILISRNGPALQPGTRAYMRSWIRDGALMGAALLRLGHPEPVREFLEWYAPYLFPNGKVPCVVDARGADPVPENDSPGEFIYLVAECDRFLRDGALLERTWPKVQKAWEYLESLIDQRRTPEYQQGPKLLFRGLVPESISHEGYAAKPMHSYWDDFFTLRGLKDAAALAERMGRKDLQPAYSAAAERFRTDLLASIRLGQARHGIGYIPGCAELGDFDATSTTVAIAPGGELASLPRQAVEATFESFFTHFRDRREGRVREDRYTPYETRIIESMVHLGWRARALELSDFYLRDRRPLAWNQWPEVVARDYRERVFLGDLPHAWVESDFIRSVISMFAFERESDRALLLGAGLPESWMRSPGGVSVERLRVPGGQIDLSARAAGDRVEFKVSGSLPMPPGGLILSWPLEGACGRVTVNGKAVEAGAEFRIRELPATVVMER